MTPTRIPTSMAMMTAMLAACGGADMQPDARTEAAPATTAGALAYPVAPLLSDDGSLMPASPEAIPADPGARTRAGRYATTAQAEQLERAMAGRLVRVGVVGSGAAAVHEAAGIAYGVLAAMDGANDAPVLVQGRDLRSAAALVDRLAAEGVANTWLVTQ